MEIPVYLFTGFLDSGKTTFIQETLEDKRFAIKENTLLLLFEEGECEYDPSRFACDVSIEVINGKEKLNNVHLEELVKKHKSARVMIEYNGMMLLSELYDAMPEYFMVYQEITLADANMFGMYNSNMRQLVFDKLSGCEVIIFNRTPADCDKDLYHKIVRGVSRNTAISYVYGDGHIEYDEIVDPLPFDTDSNEIVINDIDYALWYRDITEEPDKYKGKNVTFKGRAACDPRFPTNSFAIGRHIMECCADDIAFRPVVAVSTLPLNFKNGDWVMIRARMEYEKHPLYEGKGPVLHVLSTAAADAPEQEVATF